jgi:hypothetical protein
MILTPLIDIDNLNLSKFEPLWSLMTKGERNKDKSDRGENFDIGGEMTKGINSNFEHISRGSKLMDLVDAFECAFTYACLHLKSLN